MLEAPAAVSVATNSIETDSRPSPPTSTAPVVNTTLGIEKLNPVVFAPIEISNELAVLALNFSNKVPFKKCAVSDPVIRHLLMPPCIGSKAPIRLVVAMPLSIDKDKSVMIVLGEPPSVIVSD